MLFMMVKTNFGNDEKIEKLNTILVTSVYTLIYGVRI